MPTTNTYRPGRYASIDIGTVTCRLLVADIAADGTLTQVARDREITNLGEGVDATGVLGEAAMERVGAAMDRFLEVLRAHPDAQGRVPQPTVIATSASRDAQNADTFAQMMEEKGLALTIVPGEREAALSFLGATQGFTGERVLVVDSGGGSTEVVAGIAGAAPSMARSFNIGCRRATERFLGTNSESPIDEADMREAREWARSEMAPYFDELRSAGHLPARMIAVAGTATTAVSVREAMQVYDASRVHGAAVSHDDLDNVYERLARLPLAERQQVAGLEPRRATVICAGFAILQVVMDLAEVETYTVSESDILQGIVLDAASK